MHSKTAEHTIKVFKTVFAQHGIPNTVTADDMPFASHSVRQFAQEWSFNIITSSPHYPQSNGLVERHVQTVKMILKKARDSGTDENLPLLEFRNTPIVGMTESPSQLQMGRHYVPAFQ